MWSDADIDWSAFDACLLRTTWDYQERLDEFMAWAERAATQTRFFNPIDIVRWNTHKSYLRDLEARGAPTVPTIWLDRGQTIDLGATLEQTSICGLGQVALNPILSMMQHFPEDVPR